MEKIKTCLWSAVTMGTPIYAIDEHKVVVRGQFQKHLPDGMVELLDEAGDVRTFHARFCQIDSWRSLEDL